MNERGANILEAVVREYIGSGEPVSSAQLFERYDFGVKPATIRAELANLTDEGLLAQPHHSAGRVPTDTGYAFFAERMLHNELRGAIHDSLCAMFDARDWDNFMPRFSERLGMLGIMAGERAIRANGLEYLIKELIDESHDAVMEIVRDFETFEERYQSIDRFLPERDFLEIFVGRRNPFTRSSSVSVIAGDYDIDGERKLLIAIGPKRMDYERAATLFKQLKKQIYGRE